MPSYGIRVALALLLIHFGVLSAAGQEQIFRQEFPDLPDTFVQVESLFGIVARQGALPYRITIRNNSGRDRIWTVELREGYHGRSLSTASRFRIEAKNGTETVREVSFSFAPAFLAYDHRNLSTTASSPGLPSLTRTRGEQTNQSFPALAMSMPLAQRSLVRLNDSVKRAHSGNPTFAKSFESDSLPSDWIGYTGLDAILIDWPSWQRLAPAQNQALLAWVRLGGQLDVYAEGKLALSRLNLPASPTDPNATTAKLSLGEVRILPWDGSELPESAVKRYESLPSASDSLDQDYGSGWGLRKDFGVKDSNPALVFFLLLAFAILVAPVNLFYLAKPGRRHLLFLTTPLISIVTCILVVALILFLDGVGGKGLRVVLADLQSSRGEMRLYLTQEQLSRTGVVVNPGFESKHSLDLNPANLSRSHYNPFSQGGNRSTTYEREGNRYQGGFFRSRSEQAFLLRTTEPTRARIELAAAPTAEGTPALSSRMPQTLAGFAYLDLHGELWTSPDGVSIAPGEAIPLERTASDAWPVWVQEATDRFSESRKEVVEALREDRNRFFARIEKPDELALPTHPGIRWGSTHFLLTGTPSQPRDP